MPEPGGRHCASGELGLVAPRGRPRQVTTGCIPGEPDIGLGFPLGAYRIRRTGQAQEMGSRVVSQQQIADDIVPLREQGLQRMRIRPVDEAFGKVQIPPVPSRIGSAQVALGTHVEHPPGQAVAVQGGPACFMHDEAIRADRDERPEMMDSCLRIHPVDFQLCQPPGPIP